MREIKIPSEVADGITKATLIDHRNYLVSENEQWLSNPKTEDNPDGYWLHPDDLANNFILIRSMNKLIAYFGGE